MFFYDLVDVVARLGNDIQESPWCLRFRGGDRVVCHFVTLAKLCGQKEAVTRVVWAELCSYMLCLGGECQSYDVCH